MKIGRKTSSVTRISSAIRWLTGTLLLLLQTTDSLSQLAAAEPARFPGKKSEWNGYVRYDFKVDGKPVLVVTPKTPAPGRPWVWHGEFFGHKPAPDIALLGKGFHVVYMRVPNMLGSPRAVQHWNAFYQELTQKYGFAKKTALVGLSRGGLYCYNWAAANPNQVACIYGDAPVCDFRSWPGGKGKGKGSPRDWKLVLETYGFKNEADALAYARNPVDNLEPLAKAGVPLLHVYGDADKVVPWDENTGVIAERYRKFGGSIKLIAKPGVGHHPHGLKDSTPIIEFITKHAAAKHTAPAKPVKKQNLQRKRSQVVNASISKDLEYRRAGDKRLLLDLYRPKNAKGRLPVVVWVHGSGWKNGSKNRCPATWLVEHGYAVASINYRLTHEAQWPAQIDDCRAAVRWLRVNADKYGLDGDHIAAWGGSAGAHLVALMGTLAAPEDEATSSRVQAVCDWYGPTDLLTMPPNVPANGRTLEDIAKSNGAKLLGGTVRDLPELAKQASAFYQVSNDDSPFLIMHGEKDPAVPLEQSQRLHDKLTAVGVCSTLHIVVGAGHGGKAFHTPEVREIILEFFNQHLRTVK